MTLTETRARLEVDELVASPMRVRKRDGSLEPVDVNKIVRAVSRCCAGLEGVDPMRVATRTISGLCDGASTEELDTLSIRTATALVAEEPNYSRLAARLLTTVIDKEVANQDIHSFSQAVAAAHRLGVVGEDTAGFVARYARKLNDAVVIERDEGFELFGLRTVYDRYLLRHPETASGSRNSAVLPVAGGVWPRQLPRGSRRSLRVDVWARIPPFQPDSFQLGHRAPANVLLLLDGLATRRARLDL